MSSEPRSARVPWVRASLMGLWPLLLPFVWVLELDSCGHPIPLETELTGRMVLGKFELEAWMLAVPILLLVVLTPYLARWVQRLGLRVWVHVLGFIAAAFAAYLGFFAMFFTLFSDRRPWGMGWVVMGTFVDSFLDALLRVVWSTQEWRRAKTQPPA